MYAIFFTVGTNFAIEMYADKSNTVWVDRAIRWGLWQDAG
jgi:hypothetical protein